MKTRNTLTMLAAIVSGSNRTRFFSIVRIATAGTLISALAVMAVILGTEALVTVGSPPSPIVQSIQVEPALAVDAAHPNVLAAGAADFIDQEAYNAGDDTTFSYTLGTGVSGVYFSFDSGHTWIQPTYTGNSQRFGINNSCLGVVGSDPGCTPDPNGPVGTLPWYYENGLMSFGDPAVAFGPRPDANGNFSWTNGSRLYYANLAWNLGGTFRGAQAIYVSRTDDVAAAAASDKNAWMQPALCPSKTPPSHPTKTRSGRTMPRRAHSLAMCTSATRPSAAEGTSPSRSWSRSPATVEIRGHPNRSARRLPTFSTVTVQAPQSAPTATALCISSSRTSPSARPLSAPTRWSNPTMAGTLGRAHRTSFR